MKKAIKIIILIAVLVLIILVVARIATGEDSWICKEGKWIEHGHTIQEKPIEPCKESWIQTLFNPE